MGYKHGHVVSIPDPHGVRPSRPAVIISDDLCPDHPRKYTVAMLTSSQQYGQNDYAIEVRENEPIEGKLKTRSYVEPWATETISHGYIERSHARFGKDTMKRVAEGYARMVLR